MKMHALRLTTGDDILLEIEKYIQQQNITKGVILSAIGDVSEAKLLNIKTMDSSRIKEPMDIMGITGTVSHARIHLHVTFARKSFSLIGGHLPHGCYVGDSAEIIIGEFAEGETASHKTDTEIKVESEHKLQNTTVQEKSIEYDSLVTNLFKK